jgi:hypothetical protein
MAAKITSAAPFTFRILTKALRHGDGTLFTLSSYLALALTAQVAGQNGKGRALALARARPLCEYVAGRLEVISHTGRYTLH